ncbi:PDZ domain-containing protein [bacterium]|nr:PDZ domain-containing protein [bacterium]
MRQQIATFAMGGFIFTISAMTSASSVSGQGFLKRLQERVQSLDQQNAAGQDANATEPGGSESGARRPLVDALLQYGPEIFNGQSNDGQGLSGSADDRSRVGVGAAVTTPPVYVGKASLGIDVLNSPPGVPGVLVTGFRSDSRADDAGLKKDDVIVSLDRTLTPNIADIAGVLSQRRPGQSVSARILRGDQMKTIQIPLLGSFQAGNAANQFRGSRQPVPAAPLPSPPLPSPPLPSPPLPGRSPIVASRIPSGSPVAPETLPPATTQEQPLRSPVLPRLNLNAHDEFVDLYGIIPGTRSRLRGAVVEGVIQGSAADAAGIKPADRVVAVDGMLARDATAFTRQLKSLPEQAIVSLGIVRGDAYLIKPLTLSAEIQPLPPADVGERAGASSESADAGEQSMEADAGVLEEIGSVLGGLLGGSRKEPVKNDPKTTPQAPREDSKTKPEKQSVRQSSFEQKVSGKLKQIMGDPPSLNGLPVKPAADPAADPTATPAKQTAAEMREQIRQLQEKLKKMQAESKEGKTTTQDDNAGSTKSE